MGMIYGAESGVQVLSPVRTPPPTLAAPAPPSPAQNRLAEFKAKSTCFRWQKLGHWAEDCPSRTPNKSQSSLGIPPTTDAANFPVIWCPCGLVCSIRVSNTEKNPNRRFFSCSVPASDSKCNLFKWCDEVKAPTCSCGAGACAVAIVRNGNKLKRRYTCRIRKGHGACDFIKWENAQRFDGTLYIESAHDNTALEVLPLEHSEPLQIVAYENERNSSPKEIIEDGEVSFSMMEKRPTVSSQTSQLEIYVCQQKFGNQVSATGDFSFRGIVLQILGFLIHGWVGRLAFSPPRSMAHPPSGPYFCCIFPNFDPVVVLKSVDMFGNGNSGPLPPAFWNCEPSRELTDASARGARLSDPLLASSSLKRSFLTLQENALRRPIVKDFSKDVALYIQKQLVSLLKSMEPADHNTMLQAAEASFGALSCLSIDCGTFFDDVGEVINCASRLSQVESSMENDHSLEELSENYNMAKHQFDEVSGIHTEAVAALASCRKHLQDVCSKASLIKMMLVQVEKQLMYCEVEASKLETHVREVSKDMSESRRKMQTAAQALSRALEAHQRKEERMRARAALMHARTNLEY